MGYYNKFSFNVYSLDELSWRELVYLPCLSMRYTCEVNDDDSVNANGVVEFDRAVSITYLRLEFPGTWVPERNGDQESASPI